MILFKKNLNFIFFISTIILVSILAFQLIKNKPIIVDELDNFETSQEISHLNITDQTFKRTTAIPGYSFTLGFIKYLFNVSSLPGSRFITTIISITFIIVFYISTNKNIFKGLQIFFSPLIFIFLYILYNDIFSLFLIILAFYFLNKNHFNISGVFGLLSVLVRQNNIVWVLFFCIYIFAKKYNFKINKKTIYNYINDIKIFLTPFLFIITFLIINKSPALKDTQSHPLSFHLGNIYFFLLIIFFLFLPLHIFNFPKIIQLLKKKPYIILGIAALYILFLFTFKFDHSWNSRSFNFFIRNQIINFTTQDIFHKIFFFFPIIYSILSLSVTQLIKKIYWLLYPFTFIFLGLSWLVEPRYSIIPYSFLLLFRKGESKSVEYLILLIYIILSIYIFWGSINRIFFL